MSHQNFQEAIERLSAGENLNSEEIKNQFNLNEEEMMAMQSYNSLIQAKTPECTVACCCCV